MASADDVKQYESLFLQALRDVLPSLKLYSDAQLTKKITPAKLTDASLEFFGFIEAGAGQGLKKNELLALANQSFRCLKKYIEAQGTPFTLKTVLDFLPLVATAVDLSFPGYADSQLLKYTILKRAV